MAKVFMIGLLLFFMTPGAWAQGTAFLPAGQAGPTGLSVRYDPKAETLGVTAPSLPLRDILTAITEKTGVVFILPPGMNPIVTRSVDPMPLERAIRQLLDLSSRNSAMIYVGDPARRNRYLLTEVRVLEGGGSLGSGSVSPVSISPVTPKPQLSPEELAARRAERDAQKAAKDAAKAKRSARSGKSGRGGDTGTSEPAASPQAPGGPSAQAPPSTTGTTVPSRGGGGRSR